MTKADKERRRGSILMDRELAHHGSSLEKLFLAIETRGMSLIYHDLCENK